MDTSQSDHIHVTHRVLFNHSLPKRAIWPLPLWISWKWKWIAGLVVCGVSLFLYDSSNKNFLTHPIPLTWLDQQIPYIPQTIWIYLSLFLFIPTAFALNRCVISMSKHLYSFLATVLTSCILFRLVPISYPREIYSHLHSDAFVYQWIEVLQTIDPPGNCFPSLHVSLSVLISLGFLEDRREYFPWMATWGSLLIISTLTIKQHYLWDVVSGVFLGTLFYVLFHRVFYYRTLASHPCNFKNPYPYRHKSNPLTG